MPFKNPFDLTGKTALVAGASRGIGLSIAQHLAGAGAHVILAARSADKLKVNADLIKADGGSADAVELDVASPASIANAVATLPPVDILVNVAGINLRKRFEDYTREEYDRIMETNLHGIFTLTQGIGKKMVDRGHGGKIIMIGSLQSISALPYLTVYAMTKSAMYGLTRVLAAEWARFNIQVNTIAPGFVITDLNRKMWEDETLRAWLKGAQADPRLATPDDIAPLAVYLASQGSNYVNGQCIAVDGGCSTTNIWPFEPS